MFLKTSQNSQESDHQSHFIKKESLTQVFSCEFCEISKNTFFTEHLRATVSIYPVSRSGKLNFFAVFKFIMLCFVRPGVTGTYKINENSKALKPPTEKNA